MMKLTYLFHSGFLLEADGFAVVFDYYRGGEAILDEASHSMCWCRTSIATTTTPRY